MGKSKKFVTTTVFTIAAAVSIMELIKFLEDETPSEKPAAYRPVRENSFCETVDGDFLSDWFEKNQEKYGVDSACFLARVTPKTMAMFAMDAIPKGMETNQHLLMAVVDKVQKLPKIVCLVNFCQMDEELQTLLGDQEYLLISNDQAEEEEEK